MENFIFNIVINVLSVILGILLKTLYEKNKGSIKILSKSFSSYNISEFDSILAKSNYSYAITISVVFENTTNEVYSLFDLSGTIFTDKCYIPRSFYEFHGVFEPQKAIIPIHSFSVAPNSTKELIGVTYISQSTYEKYIRLSSDNHYSFSIYYKDSLKEEHKLDLGSVYLIELKIDN